MPEPAPPPLINGPAARDMATRYNRTDFRAWARRAHATGGCAQPIHLRGRVEYRDSLTGALLHRYSTAQEPSGSLRVACKTRRASRCPACAEVYRADTYQLIRAGLVGGKGVAASVSAHPTAFVTLTAPSFGAVHSRRTGAGGGVSACHPRRNGGMCLHGRPVSCTVRHSADDTRLGQPICDDCFDYAGAVLWNAHAPELWRRFTMAFRRYVARSAGLRVSDLREVLTVSFAKVAEYQRRGLVHFHAVIRFDGPGGPDAAPPAWATHELLKAGVDHAASAVKVSTSAAGDVPAKDHVWGSQTDVRPISSTGELTDQAVAGYIAKYATKAAECVGTLDRRIRPTDDPADLPVSAHARRLIIECLHLSSLEEFAELRLAEWAHMLGFRGHFSTKSRRYSTTLGRLRAERIAHNEKGHQITTGRLPFDDDEVLVIADWRYVGQGLTPGEALLTAALTGQRMPSLHASP
nr:replication initiator [Actinomadura chibensis]